MILKEVRAHVHLSAHQMEKWNIWKTMKGRNEERIDAERGVVINKIKLYIFNKKWVEQKKYIRDFSVFDCNMLTTKLFYCIFHFQIKFLFVFLVGGCCWITIPYCNYFGSNTCRQNTVRANYKTLSCANIDTHSNKYSPCTIYI